ncbi:hypothetical protein METBIDRAFT_30257 [Metschnikowia bicuspidata var. bicuspidata NRRL YB-4993]|uniref:Uncharacterized protein n=1 Tax=Metschnikowia bicuspidata var. bicuspidata NRRL YB-4993 TaxID=869754 RepID=A0A1A0HJ66_9ASCO|nr:hypothetical protein METBIDRAFT_30257 [Metschnikowia bicuspidata var. bicuspidata NRRL YB-4993]OBA23883.1 hypothetical protein METBIDRAFT_30257 [Metschnikowia bicuspidata var. bicuspidata NRRL YB-4993]
MNGPFAFPPSQPPAALDHTPPGAGPDTNRKPLPAMYAAPPALGPGLPGPSLGTPPKPVASGGLAALAPLAMLQYPLHSPPPGLLQQQQLHMQRLQQQQFQQSQLQKQRLQKQHLLGQHLLSQRPLSQQQSFKHFGKQQDPHAADFPDLHGHAFQDSPGAAHMYHDRGRDVAAAYADDTLVQDPQLRHLHHLQSHQSPVQQQEHLLQQPQAQPLLHRLQHLQSLHDLQRHRQSDEHHQQNQQQQQQQQQQHQQHQHHQHHQQHQNHQNHQNHQHQHQHHRQHQHQRHHLPQHQPQHNHFEHGQGLANAAAHSPSLQGTVPQDHRTLHDPTVHPSHVQPHSLLSHLAQNLSGSIHLQHASHPAGPQLGLDITPKLGNQTIAILSKMVAATDENGSKKKRGRPKKLILDPTTNQYIDSSHANFKKLNKLLKESSGIAVKQAHSPMENGINLDSLNDQEMKQLLELKDRRGRPRKFPVEQTGITIKGVRVNGTMKGKRKDLVASLNDSDKVQKKRRGRPKRDAETVV